MFEDLIDKKIKGKCKEILYICPKAQECNAEFCLHKSPHGKTELGRPDQPENENPCDCSIHVCDYFPILKNGKVVCVPI